MKKKILVFLCVVFGLFLFANEEILNYVSDIQIGRDNTLLVVETITVRAEGKKIKRGIYREFPTDYKDKVGRRVKIRFEVVSVERNNNPIHYWVERKDNGYRVYMGSKDEYLTPGIYTYRLTYKTNRQMGFFKDHDELYWNVNGCGWAFPIKKIKAIVSLPKGFSPDNFIKWTAYTGKRGSRDGFFNAYIDTMGNLVFESTKPFAPRECMTIVVAFNKGIVFEPGLKEKIRFLLMDNKEILISVAGAILAFLYFLAAWFKVGKDPAKGAIVPQFEPPENLSPAQVGYIYRMGYSDRCLISAIVSMAIKRVIKIKEEDKKFSLIRLTEDTSTLAPEEYSLYQNWLAIGGFFKFSRMNYHEITKGIRDFKKVLKDFCEGKYFYSNRKYFLPGLFISLITLAGVAVFSQIPPVTIFVLFWLTGWSFGVFSLWKEFVSAVRNRESVIRILGLFLTSIIFTGGEFIGLFLLSRSVAVEAIFVVILIIVLNVVFAYLLKAPTKYGRKAMDKIEGLKLYLEMAETDYINYHLKFTKDVNTFKWFLPYAIALGVEKKWSEKFEGVIDETALRENFEGSGFMHQGMFSPAAFSSSFVSSMSNSISSSMTSPGSSSGFSSGGGFSGGGFAGGGGGGGGGGGF